MKRIFFFCCLLSCTLAAPFIQPATAQSTSTTVTASAFTTKVNLMDSQIGAGNITAATATWNEVHDMMLGVLAASKTRIHGATTTGDRTAATTRLNNQIALYNVIWGMKPNLAANRAALRTKLGEFTTLI